jgi:polysaccharide export outer membrane protein
MSTAARLIVLVLGGSMALAACAARVPYVWVDDVPERRGNEDYVIGTGDVVSVRVFNQEPMSVRARVRSDGKIGIPFLGDVELRGRAPAAVSKEIAARLKEYVVSPIVTVSVEEPRPTTVSVVGEVAHPGVYPVDGYAGVLQALALAGGLSDYASRDAIFVVRAARQQRIRFTFSSLVHGSGRAAAFRLEPGDAVVVE